MLTHLLSGQHYYANKVPLNNRKKLRFSLLRKKKLNNHKKLKKEYKTKWGF